MSKQQLHKGARFSSFDEFLSALNDYNEAERQKVSVKRSKTLEQVGLQRRVKEDLLYYEIYLECARSGIYKPKGKGLRKARSQKTNCPVKITAKPTKDGQYLEVLEINLDHNHPALDAQEDVCGEEEVRPDDPEPTAPTYEGTTTGDANIYLSDQDLIDLADSVQFLTDGNTRSPKKNQVSSSEAQSVVFNTNEGCAATTSDSAITKDVTDDVVRNLPPECDIGSLNIASSVKCTERAEVFSCNELGSELPVTDSSAKLSDIQMPNIKTKGRRRGAALTAIGLPIKKGPIKFASLSDDDKIKRILCWILVDKNIIDNVLSGEYLIGRRDIRLEPENLSDSIANQGDVQVEMLKPYFEKKVFKLFNKALDEKIELNTWTCKTCAGTITSECVICESCLLWYHAKCVRKVKKDADWFCARCK